MSSPQQVQYEKNPPAVFRRHKLERLAKQAYYTFAHRVGLDTAWENLPIAQMTGWTEVVEYLVDEPECRCGEILICVHCDKDCLPEKLCAVCGCCMPLVCDTCEETGLKRPVEVPKPPEAPNAG